MSAVGSGNETNISYNNDASGTYDEYTPSAYAPPVYSSAPCYVGVSAGIGVPGFSGSIGGFKYDKECEHRETIRLSYGSNNKDVRDLADTALVYKLSEIVEDEAGQKKDRDEEKSRVARQKARGYDENGCADWEISCN